MTPHRLAGHLCCGLVALGGAAAAVWTREPVWCLCALCAALALGDRLDCDRLTRALDARDRRR